MPTAEKKEIAELLAQCALFSKLEVPQREQLAAIGTLEHYDAGVQLFEEGDPSTTICLVVKGHVSLNIRRTPQKKVAVLSLGPGELLGWSALMHEERVASARTQENITLVTFPSDEFQRLCDQYRDIGYVVMKQLFEELAHRLHDTRMQLLDMFS